MSIDHAYYNALRASLDAAFAEVAKRHGLKSLGIGRITVDSIGGFRAQLTGVAAVGKSREEAEYETLRLFSDYALPAIGEEFSAGPVRYVVIGQQLRGRQRIIARKLADGKQYLLSAEAFERLFPAKGPDDERPSERAMRLASRGVPS